MQEEKFDKVVVSMVDDWMAELNAVKELAKTWAVSRVKYDHYKEKVDGAFGVLSISASAIARLALKVSGMSVHG